MMSWFKKKEISPGLSTPTAVKTGLGKTRALLGEKLTALLFGKKQLDATLLASIEDCLLTADVGVAMVQSLIKPLLDGLSRHDVQSGETVLTCLKEQLIQRLAPICQPLPDNASDLCMVLVVGVNGVGKTTTLAKLARHFQRSGKRVMLAAGDTFRAAAIEQLQHWGACYDMPVLAQKIGADSASVIYDAYQSAKARGFQVLLADTAGRLHTQHHLMDELKKIKRVLQKMDPTLPHETLLVLDASVGQNALKQVQQFHEAIGITGIVVTKLDGTAKGGVLFALAEAFSIPIRFIGVGETIDDLQPLDARAFVEAIFHDDSV